MKQAQPTDKSGCIPLLLACETGSHRTLDKASSEGRHPLPSPATRPVTAGRHPVGRVNQDQGNCVLAAKDAATPASQVESVAQADTPIVDYARASAEELLAAARSFDKEAFAELSARHIASVHRNVFRIVRNREDTEDIVQEALLKAYIKLSDFRGSCAFSTWLMAIANNSAFMLLRKRKRNCEVSIDQTGDDDHASGVWELPDPRPNAEMRYARRQTVDALSRAVVQLPLIRREVVELFYVQEQTAKEAADTLGVTLATVKSRLFQGRLTLRDSLASKNISHADVCS